MAVLSTCPGLTVEIIADGESLQEFNDVDEDQLVKTKTTYVEARTDAEFTIKWSYTKSFQAKDLGIRVFLDSNNLHSYARRRHKLGKDGSSMINGSLSRIDGVNFLRKFQFAELTIVEGRTKLLNETLIKQLLSIGAVTIRFYYITNCGDINTPSNANRPTSNVNVIPEKALNGEAKSHQAKLGKLEKQQDLGGIGAIGLTSLSPSSISDIALVALRVVPRTPSPTPLEERPEEELSQDELRELVRKFKEREAAALKIKKEGDAGRKRAIDVDAEDEEVKFVESRPMKRARGRDEEVIVLD